MYDLSFGGEVLNGRRPRASLSGFGVGGGGGIRL